MHHHPSMGGNRQWKCFLLPSRSHCLKFTPSSSRSRSGAASLIPRRRMGGKDYFSNSARTVMNHQLRDFAQPFSSSPPSLVRPFNPSNGNNEVEGYFDADDEPDRVRNRRQRNTLCILWHRIAIFRRTRTTKVKSLLFIIGQICKDRRRHKGTANKANIVCCRNLPTHLNSSPPSLCPRQYANPKSPSLRDEKLNQSFLLCKHQLQIICVKISVPVPGKIRRLVLGVLSFSAINVSAERS